MSNTATIPGNVIDELHDIRSRVSLLELALGGALNSGMSLDCEKFRDALLQQVVDIGHGLNAIIDDSEEKPADDRRLSIHCGSA